MQRATTITIIDPVNRRIRPGTPNRRANGRRAGALAGSPTEPATPGLLQLLWLASPALPVGGFSYSEGLESSVESSIVATESEASSWLSGQLQMALARGDLAVVAKAVAAWRRSDLGEVRQLNDWVLQTRESSELRLQTEQMGRSLVEWLRNQDRENPARLVQDQMLADMDPTYPVAFALAASRTRAAVKDILLAFAFGWAENMVQAALKAVPLGQSAGQRILARLAHEIPEAAERALRLTDRERQAFSPMLAILSSQHEAQYSRLFRS